MVRLSSTLPLFTTLASLATSAPTCHSSPTNSTMASHAPSSVQFCGAPSVMPDWETRPLAELQSSNASLSSDVLPDHQISSHAEDGNDRHGRSSPFAERSAEPEPMPEPKKKKMHKHKDGSKSPSEPEIVTITATTTSSSLPTSTHTASAVSASTLRSTASGAGSVWGAHPWLKAAGAAGVGLVLILI